MSLELPGWVVDVFYFVGLPWPGVDEDELRSWAGDLRTFADEITMLSGLPHQELRRLSHADRSAFVATLAQHWDHHHEQIKAMREPMHVFAGALDIAADAVVVQKGVVIGAAVTLAAAVGLTQGEALVTFGLAEAEVPVEVEVAKKAVEFALQELENKLLGYLVNKAAADISHHVNGTIGRLLMGGLGTANEAYAIKTDTRSLRALAKTINTHARRTESTSSETYRRAANRRIETEEAGGRWPVARVLEEALTAIAADLFRQLPGTLHNVMEDTEKDLLKAAETIEKADAELAADAEHVPHESGTPFAGDPATASGAIGSTSALATVAEEARNDPRQALADRLAQLRAKRLADLRAQGHGPQRHLDTSDAQLQSRLGDPKPDPNGGYQMKANGHLKMKDQIDPESGTTTDIEPKANGSPKKHICGDHATRFNNPADYLQAERYARARALETGDLGQVIPISDIFGKGNHAHRFTGYYMDPANPFDSSGSKNYLPTNFSGGHIKAFFKPDGNGGLQLRTMFPNPADGTHP